VKITRVEAYALRAPAPERPHWTSHFIVPTANELLVRLYTDEGIDGFGLATSYTPIDYVLKAVKGGILDLVVGEDALAPERLYRKLFGLTTSKAASASGKALGSVMRMAGTPSAPASAQKSTRGSAKSMPTKRSLLWKESRRCLMMR